MPRTIPVDAFDGQASPGAAARMVRCVLYTTAVAAPADVDPVRDAPIAPPATSASTMVATLFRVTPGVVVHDILFENVDPWGSATDVEARVGDGSGAAIFVENVLYAPQTSMAAGSINRMSAGATSARLGKRYTTADEIRVTFTPLTSNVGVTAGRTNFWLIYSYARP